MRKKKISTDHRCKRSLCVAPYSFDDARVASTIDNSIRLLSHSYLHIKQHLWYMRSHLPLYNIHTIAVSLLQSDYIIIIISEYYAVVLCVLCAIVSIVVVYILLCIKCNEKFSMPMHQRNQIDTQAPHKIGSYSDCKNPFEWHRKLCSHRRSIAYFVFCFSRNV